MNCGQVRRFRTSPADSFIGIARPAGAPAHVTYVAASTVRHDVVIEAPYRVVETLEDAAAQDYRCWERPWPRAPAAQVAQEARGYLVDATCSDPAGLDRRVRRHDGTVRRPGRAPVRQRDRALRRRRRHAGGQLLDLPEEIYGEAGDDQLRGGEGNDFIHGGEGNDFVASGFGADGNDVLDGGPGFDFYYCDGPGDVVLVDHAAEYAQAQALGCTPMFNAAARRAAAREAPAK